MTYPHPPQDPQAFAPVRGGLLPPVLRRDLADLNAQYLELGLTQGLDGDPRFGWSEPVRRCLLETDEATRGRVAAAPFALFDLVLPAGCLATPAARVEDSRAAIVPAGWQGRCESFAHQAVFLARRLVEGEPLALRVVMGLPDEMQRWLGECRLTQLAEAAANPRAIRPRWRVHLRFWQTLVGAARRDSPGALQWAHCIGLCLLGAADSDAAPPLPRRRPRR
jgi:hypothetical protein